MQHKASRYLLSFLVGLSVVTAGCAGEGPPAAGEEFATQEATVNGASNVTLCNLPRYTKQTTVRLCGYVTPGADGAAVASAWFTVDNGPALAVVPGSGGFVDTSTSLTEGTHEIRLYAESAIGMGHLTFDAKPVTVDLTPPALQVLSPTPADVLTSTVVNVTSSVSDATPVRVQTQWVQTATVDSGVGTVTHTVDLVNRGYNTLLVRATDAAGNVSEKRVILYFCHASDSACFASAHWAPVITRTSPSASTVPASASVTLGVEASDPQSSPLSYAWTATAGTLGVPTSGSTTSTVTWTAPKCVPVGTTPVVTATVTNALGASVSHAFTVTGVFPCATQVTALSASGSHTLAVRQDGTVWAWGSNSFGQLGDGTTTDRFTPVQVPGLSGVTAVAAGGLYSVALRQDGTVWAWGLNNSGQLGDGTTTKRPTPVRVPGLSGITAIAAGSDHTLALRQDGTVWAWGWNGFGKLGDGTVSTFRLSPVQVPGLSGVTAIAASAFHTVALRQDGTVWAWGYNSYGQLGDGTSIDRHSPVQVPGFSGVIAIDVGDRHSVALRQDGTVWAWGNSGDGQLGTGTFNPSSVPVRVPGLSGVTAIAAAYWHTAALRQDGTVWTWGYNRSGQLGDGTTITRFSPTQVPGLTGVTTLASGNEYLLALRQDGTLWDWGLNNFGQLGDGTTTNRLSPVRGPAF